MRVHDTSAGAVVATGADGPARMYVCGITPYDATHLGHAATYVAFDLLDRAWRSAGHEVRYVQNVTDVDDPLLERADATGEDWVALAERETELFRTDMEALRVIAPDAYVGAVEAIPLVVDDGRSGCSGPAPSYDVDGDLYFSVTADPSFGEVSGWTATQMLAIFAERGGDPDRPGKKDPLDCLLWQAERPGEPAWDSPFGRGRPGWHVECSAIARDHLGAAIDVQGGGSDLVFPHHEMSASEAQVAEPGTPFARAYVHAGMVGLDGEKMSKSKGNLVLVSRLREHGTRPDGDPAGPARATTTAATGSGPPPTSRPPSRRSRTCRARRRAAVRRPHRAGRRGGPGRAGRGPRRPDRRRRARPPGPHHTVTDTSEPGAGDVIRVLADAALGLEL